MDVAIKLRKTVIIKKALKLNSENVQWIIHS